jgi:hypothetical protein
MLSTLALTLFLLLALIGFEILPITNGNDDLVVMQQANFQLARNEFIAKDALVLAYRPATYHSQAISELQVQLPVFQQVQMGLLHGDSLLGLPAASDGAHNALLAAQPDYLAIVAALKALVSHPDGAPDPIYVDGIMQHEGLYVAAMYQVVTLLQQDAEARKMQFFVIKMTLAGLMALAVILKYTQLTRKVVEKMVREENI